MAKFANNDFVYRSLVATEIGSYSSTVACIEFKTITVDDDIHIRLDFYSVVGERNGGLIVFRKC